MDVAPYLDPRPAPAILFARLPERRLLPRWFVRHAAGGWHPITWQAHADAVRRVASFIARLGTGPGDRAVIFANNSVAWMEAALGVQAAGMAMVPVYPGSTAAQAAHIVSHCGAQVVFVAGSDLVGKLLLRWDAYDGVRCIVVMDDTSPHAVRAELADAGDRVPDAAAVDRRFVAMSRACAETEPADDEDTFVRRLDAIDPESVAIMLYTSGTTGDPKGVPLTHRNLGVNGTDWLQCLGTGVPEHGVDLLWLPMSHVFGYGEACLGNNLGFSSYLATPRDALRLMPTVRPTVFMSVPAYWETLAAGGTESIATATGGRLSFCLSGGAGLPLEVKERFAAAGLTILEGYGLTECSPTLTLNRPHDYRFDTVGKPLPSVQLRLGDDAEILARGPSVFSGYHRDPAATRAAFTDDGWFRTGDLGAFTDDGFLRVVGRKKDILVTAGGKNVPPANIESQFATEPAIAHVVVYGNGKKYLVAGVWLHEEVVSERLGAHADPAAREALVANAVEAANAGLARHEQIKRFRIMQRPLTVADGLLTSTLKVRRAAVYEAFHDAFEGLYL